MSLIRHFWVLCSALAMLNGFAFAQASVRVDPAHLQGPRPLQPETAKAAIRDYVQAWQGLGAALEKNRTEGLDRDFVGTAREKLAATIAQQSLLGLHTVYRDRAHDIQIVFYSPEGLSIELTDTVDYDVQIFDHDKSIGTQRMHARYIAILTPSEVRWRVRVLQADAE